TVSTNVEAFRLRNPIVEEDGTKKMKLEFDVRRFIPSEVSVKTNTKDNSLTIDAEHKSDDAKYEFHRYYVLPQGVKADGK
uniref:SHSP domain-containing protein n=1 Tax=Plectus sambesii TaxID=2011161 RepID=A0A914VDV8_9BILA